MENKFVSTKSMVIFYAVSKKYSKALAGNYGSYHM